MIVDLMCSLLDLLYSSVNEDMVELYLSSYMLQPEVQDLLVNRCLSESTFLCNRMIIADVKVFSYMNCYVHPDILLQLC